VIAYLGAVLSTLVFAVMTNLSVALGSSDWR
jgi:hypothetical protein